MDNNNKGGCGIAVHFPDKESKLNKKLNELFPSKNINGVNTIYQKFTSNKTFKEWFGDWTNPEKLEALKKQSKQRGVLNDQYEPMLHYDPYGNPYVKNIKGDMDYVGFKVTTYLNPQEFNKLINTLTGDYIIDQNASVQAYVEQRFEEELAALEEKEKEAELVLEQLQEAGDLDMMLLQEESRKDDINKFKALQSFSSDPAFKNAIIRKIEAKLEKLNFKVDKTAAEKEDNMGRSDDIKKHSLESNKSSNRAINDPEILRFMSSIPEFTEYNEDIEEQLANKTRTNYHLSAGSRHGHNSYIYMRQSTAWRLLEQHLSDILPDFETNANESLSKDAFQNFKRVLNHVVGINKHPALHYIANYLETLEDQDDIKDPESFATKFVQAFYMARQNFLITQLSLEHNAKDDGSYDMKFSIIDPGERNDPSNKYAHEFMQGIMKSEQALSNQSASVSIAEIKKQAVEALDQIEDHTPENYIKFLDDFLNKQLNLKVEPAVIKHFVAINTFDSTTPHVPDMVPLMTLIQQFFEENAPEVIKNHLTLGFKQNQGEIMLLRDLMWKGKNRISDEKRDGLIKHLLRKDGFLKQFGKAMAIFSKEGSESSILLAGGKRWGYAPMSGIHKEVNRWKTGDSKIINALRNRNYKLVQHLLDKDSPLDMLKVYLNSEFKKTNDNNPTPNNKQTEIDSHLDDYVKLFNSKDSFYDETIEKRQGLGSDYERSVRKFRNYLLVNMGADKNSLYSIHGLPNITEDMEIYNPEKQQLGVGFKELLKGYLETEIEMAAEASELILTYLDANENEKKKILMNKLIPGYHYQLEKKKSFRSLEETELTAEDFQRGAYSKLGVFSPVLKRFNKKNETSSSLLTQKHAGVPIVTRDLFSKGKLDSKYASAKAALEAHLYDTVREAIEKDFKYLKDIVLISKTDDNDNRIEKGLFDTGNNIHNGTVDTAIYNYIGGAFAKAYEFSNILTGHIGFYKQDGSENIDISDFLKRAPAVATDGKYPRHRETGIPKTYIDYFGKEHTIADKDDQFVVAIVDNINIKSSRYKDLMEKAAGETLTYSHEIADAQGFMSPEHFKDTLSRIYAWEAKDDKMYNQLINPAHKITDENIQWLRSKNKSFTPLKMVSFGMVMPGDLESEYEGRPMFPSYLKYSLAPLFPAMTKNTEMELVTDQMKKQGVEQIVFKSGSKAANPTPTAIHEINEDGSYGGLRKDMNFNPFTVDTENMKMQVEVPTKLDKDTLFGMQAFKNILTNLLLDEAAYDVYDPVTGDKRRMTGKEVYDEVNNTANDILQDGLDSVLKRIGYNNAEKQEQGEPKFDVFKVKRLLMKQMDIETEQDLISFLRTDMPFDTIPNFAQRAFPVLSSFVKDKAGKIYTNGASMVQVANIGFDRILKKNTSKSGIFFFDKNNTELKPPLPATNDAGEILYYDQDGEYNTKKDWGKDFDPSKHKMRIAKAKILLPFGSIFEKTGLSYNQFQKLYKAGKIDKDLFQNILGYRIPNQAMSSNDSIEIVGILPPVSGDQAVVYHEITAKTGSDFDIDKMYLAMPEFNVKKSYSQAYLNAKEKIKKKYQKEYMHIGNFMEYKYASGNDIMRELAEHPNLRMFLEHVGAKENEEGELSHPEPIKLIYDYQYEIQEIISDSGNADHVAATEDGLFKEDLSTQELFDDILEASNKQRIYLDKVFQNKVEEYKELEKDLKGADLLHDKVEKVEYATKGIKGKRNRLIQLFNGILESQPSYADLMAELDNPIIKNTINKVVFLKALDAETREAFYKKTRAVQQKEINAYIEDNKINAIEQLFPVAMMKSRADVLEAKTLVAIMANNMTDIGESQKTGFALEFDLGFNTKSGVSVKTLDREFQLDKENNPSAKLSRIVSYFMNASVDAAKDSYITSGNVNSYTANGVMMMARLGISLDDLFTITMNDEILNYSRYKTFQKSKAADFSFDFNQKELDNWSVSMISKLAGANGDLWSVISKEDFLSNNPEKRQDILGYWNLIQTMGKEFNNAVVAMKSESNGAGKNIAEMISINNRLERVKKDAVKNSFKKWHESGTMSSKFNPEITKDPGVKTLGVMANNTLNLINELSEEMFIEASPEIKEVINQILSSLGRPLETNEDMIKLLYNYIYPYLLNQSGNELYDIDETLEEELLKDLPDDLQELKYELRGEYHPFLEELRVETGKDKNSIVFPAVRTYTQDDINEFKQDFMEVMNLADNHPDPKFHKIMYKLVQYAFVTTGFKSTFFSFNEMIPASFFVNNVDGSKINPRVDVRTALTLMAQVNHNNFKIVKNLYKKDLKGRAGSEVLVIEPKYESALEKLQITKGKYAPFLKYNNKLYMHTEKDEDNDPVYERITALEERGVKTYSFHQAKMGVKLYDVKYTSETRKLYARAAKNKIVDLDKDMNDDIDNCNTK